MVGQAPLMTTARLPPSTEQDLVAEVRGLTGGKGADLVFDPVAGPAFAQSVEATGDGGTLIPYGALDGARPTTLPPFDVLARGLTIRGLALPRLTQIDAEFAALKQFVGSGLADGTLKPVITRTFAFDQIVEAHRFMESGEEVGKIVATL